MSSPPCPRCSGTTVPFLFGLPTPAASKAAAAGELILGGCVVWEDAIEEGWQCLGCGHHFQATDRALWLSTIESIVSRHSG
ncbi:hypothetical protein FLW16_35680 [Microbispora sp. KK1-11]|nr:hypothetical protein FLW16_35680 [Microbispora sp. KK1-11]